MQNDPGSSHCSAHARQASAQVAALAVVGLGMIGLAAAVGLLSGRLLQPNPDSPVASTQDDPQAARLFVGWPRPDVAIVLSGEMHGYLLPCGCSRPQKGGLERRYNFMQGLKERGWPVAAADLGDLPPHEGPLGPRRDLPDLQALLKYVTAMKSLNAMGYTAIGVGEYERNVPLTRALDEYALNEKKPRVVVANLANKADFDGEVGDWQLAEVPGSTLKVGVAGIEGKALVKKDLGDGTKVKFGDRGPALDHVLKEMADQKVDVRVLLYQGKAPEAVLCARAYPQFQIILCLDESDEPPSRPTEVVGRTMIITVGHKGKNIGVVGVYRTAQPGQLELRYQMVEMTENYQTPQGKEETNPVTKILEEYTARLKKEGYLRKYRPINHPLQQALLDQKKALPDYVGSKQCASCHAAAYRVWEQTPHAHAYKTLVDAKWPSNRQYDAECVICHVTGFGYKTGFTDETDPNFKILKDVGCEVCHGPGGAHVDNSADATLYPLINPWKFVPNEAPAAKQKRMLEINKFCMNCHDSDNDVHWNAEVFEQKRWPIIEHHTPKKDEKK